jgi:glycosyltransferase involved in cell wall biosynthesis
MTDAGAPLTVAYVMSRFPKLTETFILDELVAVDRVGVRIELFPLLRERTTVMHPEAAAWVERAHYLPFLSLPILRSNLGFLIAHPRRYLGTFGAMLRGTFGSANFLVGGLGIFPKTVHAATEMRRLGVEHVQCHFATHPALAGFLIHRLVGIPYSFTAHGSDLHVDRTMLCQKAAEAAFCVTISRSNAAVFERECGGHVPNLEVIHCGIDGSVFQPTERPATGTLQVTCIGTLHEVKGQRYLIEAISALAARGVDVQATFIGDGEDREALERQVAELGIADRVTFAGQRPRAEVLQRLAVSDVLVAPSVPTAEGKREGLPVVLIEALAAGVPAVASDLSGIPELVETDVTGILVPPGDSAAIADALERLARDPDLRARLAAGGRSRVAAEFDLDANARHLIERFRASAAAARATATATPARVRA